MTQKLRIILIVGLVVTPLDYLTKIWVETHVPVGGWINVIDGFFRLTHARNSGAALGILPELPWWVFVVLTSIALGLVVSFYRQIGADDRLSASALGLILAGAIGNLIDRVFRHEVVDFLQFDLGLFIFPDFNVADSAICVGVALLMLDFIASEGQGEDGASSPESDSSKEGSPEARKT